MKKRLLITSIVMMLVVAVALSTATYAWFTSNTSVTASTVTMTAATNGQDSIFIKWAGGTYGASIATTRSYGGDVLIPMTPNEIVTNQTTLNDGVIANGGHDIAFQTAGLTTVASVSTFKDVATVNTANYVYFAKEVETENPGATSGANVIFIKNTSTANVVNNIKVTASFTPEYIECAEGELAKEGYAYFQRGGEGPNYTWTAFKDVAENNNTDVVVGTTNVYGYYKATVELVRIAIFTRDLDATGTNDAATPYTLRGVLANTASNPTFFGTIADNDSQEDFKNSANAVTGSKNWTGNTVAATAGATGVKICYDGGSLHTLKAGGEVEVKILMWLDGEELNDNTQGAIAKVGLTFEATNA